MPERDANQEAEQAVRRVPGSDTPKDGELLGSPESQPKYRDGDAGEAKVPSTSTRNEVEELIARSEELARLADNVAAKSERISTEFAQLLRRAADTLKKAEMLAKRAR